MGEMRIRGLDDALLAELERAATPHGLVAEEMAARLIREGLSMRPSPRSAAARAIIDAQPRTATHDSV